MQISHDPSQKSAPIVVVPYDPSGRAKFESEERVLARVLAPWVTGPDVMHGFCKPSDTHGTHHLHIILYRSRLWQARLRFRDALRADSSLAAEYARLKLRLADQCRYDHEAYTDSKTEFVQRVLESIGLSHPDLT